MRVFVTGATGFIGRRLVDRLLQQGDQVSALVRKQDHHLPPDVKIVPGDLFSSDVIQPALQGIERLYHLAAKITFDPAQREELLRINAQGTEEILTLARRAQIPRSILVSSACTIGISMSPNVALDEQTPFNETLALRNPYLASKHAAEQAALRAADHQHVVLVNPTTVYGPGDFSLNSGTLIQKIASANVLPLPSGGSNVVDVDDVVEGILLAAEHGSPSKRYILAGENLPFASIFNTIATVTQNQPRFLPLPRWMRFPTGFAAAVLGKLGENRFLSASLVEDLFAYKYYSSQLAETELNWKKQFTFEQSARRAWQFYQQNNLISVQQK